MGFRITLGLHDGDTQVVEVTITDDVAGLAEMMVVFANAMEALVEFSAEGIPTSKAKAVSHPDFKMKWVQANG